MGYSVLVCARMYGGDGTSRLQEMVPNFLMEYSRWIGWSCGQRHGTRCPFFFFAAESVCVFYAYGAILIARQLNVEAEPAVRRPTGMC